MNSTTFKTISTEPGKRPAAARREAARLKRQLAQLKRTQREQQRGRRSQTPETDAGEADRLAGQIAALEREIEQQRATLATTVQAEAGLSVRFRRLHRSAPQPSAALGPHADPADAAADRDAVQVHRRRGTRRQRALGPRLPGRRFDRRVRGDAVGKRGPQGANLLGGDLARRRKRGRPTRRVARLPERARRRPRLLGGAELPAAERSGPAGQGRRRAHRHSGDRHRLATGRTRAHAGEPVLGSAVARRRRRRGAACRVDDARGAARGGTRTSDPETIRAPQSRRCSTRGIDARRHDRCRRLSGVSHRRGARGARSGVVPGSARQHVAGSAWCCSATMPGNWSSSASASRFRRGSRSPPIPRRTRISRSDGTARISRSTTRWPGSPTSSARSKSAWRSAYRFRRRPSGAASTSSWSSASACARPPSKPKQRSRS